MFIIIIFDTKMSLIIKFPGKIATAVAEAATAAVIPLTAAT